MRLHYLQHVPFEGLGQIEAWARARRCAITHSELFAAADLPAVEAFDWLVVLGGPMSAYEEHLHPWLAGEKRLIEQTVAAGKRVLGVCLGAQLLADVLGARVYPNAHKEIGWWPVRRTPQARASGPLADAPETFEAFHWHGDTFDLPSQCQLLASSEAAERQAFALGDGVLGLQFHIEYTAASIEAMVRNCPGDLAAGPFVRPTQELDAPADRLAACHQLLFSILDRMVGGAA